MKIYKKRSNVAARACKGMAKKVNRAASRPFVRAGLALLVESSVAFAFMYMRRRMRERGAS